MKINFVGNYQSGYVGEEADEVHLTRELENLGNEVQRIPRDVWREWVLGSYDTRPDQIPEDMKADINIICKWHHFFTGSFIEKLREQSGAPVMYWVWDYMYDQGFPDWHLAMAKAADLYLSNEGGLFDEYKKHGVKPYYFPMDVCDGEIPVFGNLEKKYDLVFPGSYLQQGDRVPFLKEINKVHPVKIFSWNWEEWFKEGFDASPAVYGVEFNRMIAESRIVLGFSVNPHCWGYWSNRMGKVLRAGGTLIYQHAPGMELLPVSTFSTVDEAITLIEELKDNEDYLLKSDPELWTSRRRCLDLTSVLHFYLNEGAKWNQLP